MNEIMFVGSIALLALLVLWLASLIRRRDTGRNPKPTVDHETHVRAPRHRPAAHSIKHEHLPQSLLYSHDEVWRASRAKADESHWVPGVFVANQVLTDAERAARGADQEHGYRARTVEYKPADDQSDTPRRAVGRAGRRKP
jgi:hypothetical protein